MCTTGDILIIAKPVSRYTRKAEGGNLKKMNKSAYMQEYRKVGKCGINNA